MRPSSPAKIARVNTQAIASGQIAIAAKTAARDRCASARSAQLVKAEQPTDLEARGKALTAIAACPSVE